MTKSEPDGGGTATVETKPGVKMVFVPKVAKTKKIEAACKKRLDNAPAIVYLPVPPFFPMNKVLEKLEILPPRSGKAVKAPYLWNWIQWWKLSPTRTLWKMIVWPVPIVDGATEGVFDYFGKKRSPGRSRLPHALVQSVLTQFLSFPLCISGILLGAANLNPPLIVFNVVNATLTGSVIAKLVTDGALYVIMVRRINEEERDREVEENVAKEQRAKERAEERARQKKEKKEDEEMKALKKESSGSEIEVTAE